MLTRVQIKNVNAIDYCDIDFQKSKYKYLDNMIYEDKLVNPIAFYGSNGSGKSSFFKAISHLIKLMIYEPRTFSPFTANNLNIDNYIKKLKEKYEENEELPKSVLDPINSFVKLFFEINGNEYEYHIETSLQSNIAKEYLIVNGFLVFTRDKESYSYRGKHLKASASLYPALRKIAADNQDDENISTAFDFLCSMGSIDAVKRNCYFKDAVEKDFRDLIADKSTEIKDILSKYQDFPSYSFLSKITNEGNKEYYIQLDLDDGTFLSMPHQFMSSGMFHQSMLLSVLLSLPSNGVLFVDEIEDALHPLTILDFIKVAQQRNVQLIFSSHNTYLLQKLRPDQIFFANWKNGYSSYKKLSDIYPNIREINNIEKMYFANMFDEEIKNG